MLCITYINFVVYTFLTVNLYWVNVDSDETLVEVSRLNGDFRMVIHATVTESPRSIAVDPSKRYLYWADQGQNPAIVRLNLDCSERKVLASDGISEPNDITIDPDSHYIYWVDSKADTISRVDPDGQKVETIQVGLAKAVGLAVLGQDMYWVDENLKRILKATSLPLVAAVANNSFIAQTVRSGIAGLSDVAIYDKRMQGKSKHKVIYSNHLVFTLKSKNLTVFIRI